MVHVLMQVVQVGLFGRTVSKTAYVRMVDSAHHLGVFALADGPGLIAHIMRVSVTILFTYKQNDVNIFLCIHSERYIVRNYKIININCTPVVGRTEYKMDNNYLYLLGSKTECGLYLFT